MINQSILLPMPLKTFTVVGGGSLTVSPGIIMSAQANTAGTATNLRIRNDRGSIDSPQVTEMVADVILGTMLFPVTPVGGRLMYIRADTVSNLEPAGSHTRIKLLSDPAGQDQGASLLVTDSIATLKAAIAAVTESLEPVIREDLVADGLVQGGAPITPGTNLAVVTGIDSLAGNVAATLPDGAEEMKIKVQAARRDFVAGALNLFPALGETFYGDYTSNQPMLISAGHTADLVYRDGAWMDDESADTSVSISAISPPANDLSLLTTDGVEYMSLGERLLDMVEASLKVSLDDVTVTGSTFANAVPVESVVHHVTVCPTDLFAIRLRGEGNMRWIYNATMNTLGVYPGLVTESINGTVASPTVAPGQVRAGGLSQAIRDTTGNWQLREVQPGRPLALTAFAGGGQASATVISAPNATVAACATDGDSIKLSNDYQKVTLSTGGITTQVAVFPPSGGAINGAAANASVILPGRCIVAFTLIALNQWAMSIELGPQSGVAKAGGGAAFATPIIGGSLIMETVATANDSFILNSVAPRNIFVRNATLTSARIFPPTGGTINGGAVDDGFDVATTLKYIFYSNNGVNWFTNAVV